MIKKRIIPKILLQESVKTRKLSSVTSVGYRVTKIVGDPESQSEIYQSTTSDELMVLHTRLSKMDFEKTLQILEKICRKAFMPISFGGAISTIEQVNQIFDIGVEKVIFGRAIYSNPNIVTLTASKFGSQAVVASLDFRAEQDPSLLGTEGIIFTSNREFSEVITWTEKLGAGEICLSDMDADGKMCGSNIGILNNVRELTNLPIIQNCGIGKTSHFIQAFESGADAIAVGSYFAFQDQNFIEIRSHIRNSGIDIRV